MKKIVNFVSVKLHLRFLMTILYNNIIIYALSLPYSVVRFYFLAPEVPEVGVRGVGVINPGSFESWVG